MKQAVWSISGNFWGLTAGNIFVTFSDFRRAVYKSFCSAWVSAMSSWGLHDLQCLLHLFSTSPCASALLYISKFKSSLQAVIPPHESNLLSLHLHCVVFHCQPPHFSSLNPVMFRLPLQLTALNTFLSPAYFSSCQSFFLALRPVLLSTKFSSFSRLGGIIPSLPRAGFLLVVLQPLLGGTGKGMGCECLDGDGQGSRGGWLTSREGLLNGTSGALSRLLFFGKLPMVLVLGTPTSMLVPWLPPPREALLLVSCGQTWQIKMNCSRLNSSQLQKHRGQIKQICHLCVLNVAFKTIRHLENWSTASSNVTLTTAETQKEEAKISRN